MMKLTPKATMPKADPPCLDCKDRVVGCHSTCERYKAFQEDRLKLYEQIRHNTLREKAVDDVMITSAYKVSGKKKPQR